MRLHVLINFVLIKKNDRNGGIWQSGISKSLAEYVQRRVCFVNVQSSYLLLIIFLPITKGAGRVRYLVKDSTISRSQRSSRTHSCQKKRMDRKVSEKHKLDHIATLAASGTCCMLHGICYLISCSIFTMAARSAAVVILSRSLCICASVILVDFGFKSLDNSSPLG